MLATGSYEPVAMTASQRADTASACPGAGRPADQPSSLPEALDVGGAVPADPIDPQVRVISDHDPACSERDT